MGHMSHRRSSAHRWVDIGLRTAHLGAMAAFLGGAILGEIPRGSTELVVLTGLLMCASELSRHGLDWLRYTQAWTVIIKVTAFAVATALGYPLWGAGLALVLGSVISHAPGAIRHAAVLGEAGPCAGECTREGVSDRAR